MGDFHQNGIITTLHNLSDRPLEDLEADFEILNSSNIEAETVSRVSIRRFAFPKIFGLS